MASSTSPSSVLDSDLATDTPNSKGYELSSKIMLSAIIILFAVVIFMICLHLYARWYLIRARQRQLSRRNRRRRQNHHSIVFYVDSNNTILPAASVGLDPSVLKSIPIFKFDSLNEKNKDVVSECAVCLSEFEDGEQGRSLPKCKHSFHLECIDMWFHSHSTCPLCRATVEPEPSPVNAEEAQAVQVVVVDSVSPPESGTSSDHVRNEAAPSTSALHRTEPKGFSIDIPRNELVETEFTTESSQSFKSPGSRIMRILSRGLSMSSSPSSAAAAGSSRRYEGCDLERGTVDGTSQTQTPR